jgi:hypothetical protein
MYGPLGESALEAHHAVTVISEMQDLEAVSADHIISHSIAGTSAESIRQLRMRMKSPSMEPEDLILKMEAHGLPETASELPDYVGLLQLRYLGGGQKGGWNARLFA